MAIITKTFVAAFTSGGSPATGLTPLPTITIRRVSDNVAVISGESATEIGDGWYKYDFVAFDTTEAYVATWNGGSSLLVEERSFFGATESEPIEEVAGSVWEEARASHTTVGTFGEALDETVSSRESEADAATRASTNQTEHDATQSAIGALNDLSSADVQSALTAQGYTSARATNLDQLDVSVSSRAAPGDAMDLVNSALDSNSLDTSAVNEIDTFLTANHGAGDWTAPTAAQVADQVWDESRASHTVAGSFGEALDANVSSRAAPGDAMDLVADAVDSASLAASAVSEIDSGLSAAHGAGNWEGAVPAAGAIATAVWDEARSSHITAGTFGESLQATVLSRASAAQAIDIQNDVTTILDDTAAMEPLVSAHLDADVSSRAAPGAAMDLIDDALDANSLAASAITEFDDALSTSHGAGSWEGTDADIIADQVWDEPRSAHASVGSFGEFVDARMSSRASSAEVASVQADTTSILADTAAMEPLISSNLDAQVSSRQSEIDANSRAFNDQAAHTATQTAIGALNDLSSGDVQGAMDAQGYTAVRAGSLDNLDAQVSSRSAPGDAMDLVADAVDSAAMATSGVTEIRDSILADGVAFDGANVDAAISSRAAPGDAMTLEASVIPAIVAAVLDEHLYDHLNPGSLGESVALALGLVQNNFRMDQTAYDPNGLMISARFRIWDSAANVGTGTGLIATYIVSATPGVTPGTAASYQVTRQ